jgi:hypothetical protein
MSAYFFAAFPDKGFTPEPLSDASRGERYCHLLDPDGHELSFAKPLKAV